MSYQYSTTDYSVSQFGDVGSNPGTTEVIYHSLPTQRTRTEVVSESRQDSRQTASNPATSYQGSSRPSSDDTTPDDFFKMKFYFPGMASVIGSALSEGVHVDERHRDRAVEPDHTSAMLREQLYKDEYPLVSSCGKQAHNIYNGLKDLHHLLDNVPTYTDSSTPVTFRPSGSTPVPDVTIDDPIHGEKYFRVNRRNHNFYRDNY